MYIIYTYIYSICVNSAKVKWEPCVAVWDGCTYYMAWSDCKNLADCILNHTKVTSLSIPKTNTCSTWTQEGAWQTTKYFFRMVAQVHLKCIWVELLSTWKSVPNSGPGKNKTMSETTDRVVRLARVAVIEYQAFLHQVAGRQQTLTQQSIQQSRFSWQRKSTNRDQFLIFFEQKAWRNILPSQTPHVQQTELISKTVSGCPDCKSKIWSDLELFTSFGWGWALKNIYVESLRSCIRISDNTNHRRGRRGSPRGAPWSPKLGTETNQNAAIVSQICGGPLLVINGAITPLINEWLGL